MAKERTWSAIGSRGNPCNGFLMSILFVPSRKQILICDFEYGRIEPSLGKVRRALVISPRSYNRRHGYEPGRCLVVPFTKTCPVDLAPAHVQFPADKYVSLSVPTWALCDCLRSVSHARLDRVNVAGVNYSEMISEEDMARVDVGLRHAVGLA
jgi:uncharacterized protein YifN (PemK superfamily)